MYVYICMYVCMYVFIATDSKRRNEYHKSYSGWFLMIVEWIHFINTIRLFIQHTRNVLRMFVCINSMITFIVI